MGWPPRRPLTSNPGGQRPADRTRLTMSGGPVRTGAAQLRLLLVPAEDEGAVVGAAVLPGPLAGQLASAGWRACCRRRGRGGRRTAAISARAAAISAASGSAWHRRLPDRPADPG